MIPLVSVGLGLLVLNTHQNGPSFSFSFVHKSVSPHVHRSRRLISRNDGSIKMAVSSPSSTSISVNGNLPDTSQPINPNTFAGMIEKGLKERFDETYIERVLTSWRLVDQGYYRKEYVGDEIEDDDTYMIQECHSYVPGLTIKPFWDPQEFDWAKTLESCYSEIREEFDTVTGNMQKLQREGNNIWASALTEDASSYGEGWKTLVLMDRGRWDPVNANLFPKTAQAIYGSGLPATEVFFACMEGPSSIKKHSDFTNFVLTSHLALDIPYSGENKCRLTVGNETHEWIDGKSYVFDTSILHDAENESDKNRFILMMRFWHPDLTSVEREALQFTFDCLEYDQLLSPSEEERFKAEAIVEASRSFPLIPEHTSEGKGFRAQIKTPEINAKGFGKKKKQYKRKQKGATGGKKKGFG
jgi:aspartyl/asparaginyl beta-hydroxylase (cupin superfamily)